MGVWGNDAHRLSDSGEDKEAAVNIVVGAYRSLRSPVAYVSMPITTGKRFYEVLDAHGASDLAELTAKGKNLLYTQVIQPNIKEGLAFADKIASRVDVPVIAPAVFEAKQQRWSQDEYMFLWFRVIEEKAREIHLFPGWEYSTGGSLEFTRAMEMQFGFINPLNGMEYWPRGDSTDPATYARMRNIKVYDAQGDEVRITQGAQKLADAIKDLRSRGFNADKLMDPLCKLVSIGHSCNNPSFLHRCVAFIHAPYEYDSDTLDTIVQDFGLVNAGVRVQ